MTGIQIYRPSESAAVRLQVEPRAKAAEPTLRLQLDDAPPIRLNVDRSPALRLKVDLGSPEPLRPPSLASVAKRIAAELEAQGISSRDARDLIMDKFLELHYDYLTSLPIEKYAQALSLMVEAIYGS